MVNMGPMKRLIPFHLDKILVGLIFPFIRMHDIGSMKGTIFESDKMKGTITISDKMKGTIRVVDKMKGVIRQIE